MCAASRLILIARGRGNPSSGFLGEQQMVPYACRHLDVFSYDV
jgi:hypothetical protein